MLLPKGLAALNNSDAIKQPKHKAADSAVSTPMNTTNPQAAPIAKPFSPEEVVQIATPSDNDLIKDSCTIS